MAVLRGGGVVALPTDTVYGIAVAMDTPGGIERLFHVKQRPLDKAIALLLADAAQAAELGELSAAALALADGLLAGSPDARPSGERRVRGSRMPSRAAPPPSGVRLPDHATPRILAAAVGPLPTTSGNRSGRPDPLDAASVADDLGDGVDLILDGGRTPGSDPRPSSTRRPTRPRSCGRARSTRRGVRAILTAASAVGR